MLKWLDDYSTIIIDSLYPVEQFVLSRNTVEGLTFSVSFTSTDVVGMYVNDSHPLLSHLGMMCSLILVNKWLCKGSILSTWTEHLVSFWQGQA